MTKFSNRLRDLRIEAGYSQVDFAKLVGINRSSINMYERGDREPGLEKLELFADFFNVDMDYLLGKSDIRRKVDLSAIPDYPNVFPISVKKYPLLGSIACGEPIFMNEDRESYILSGTDVQADFCLKCKGDSMINARILDGDVVFIRKQEQVENGEIAAVAIEDEATLKRVLYYPELNMIILRAENSKYPDMIFTNEELNTIKILGKAVAFQSDVI